MNRTVGWAAGTLAGLLVGCGGFDVRVTDTNGVGGSSNIAGVVSEGLGSDVSTTGTTVMYCLNGADCDSGYCGVETQGVVGILITDDFEKGVSNESYFLSTADGLYGLVSDEGAFQGYASVSGRLEGDTIIVERLGMATDDVLGKVSGYCRE